MLICVTPNDILEYVTWLILGFTIMFWLVFTIRYNGGGR